MTKRQNDQTATQPRRHVTTRPKWRLRTLIEILPIIIALTALFSYRTVTNRMDVDLVTPIAIVLAGVPLWVAGLMLLVASVGILGMGWLIYIVIHAEQ